MQAPYIWHNELFLTAWFTQRCLKFFWVIVLNFFSYFSLSKNKLCWKGLKYWNILMKKDFLGGLGGWRMSKFKSWFSLPARNEIFCLTIFRMIFNAYTFPLIFPPHCSGSRYSWGVESFVEQLEPWRYMHRQGHSFWYGVINATPLESWPKFITTLLSLMV